MAVGWEAKTATEIAIDTAREYPGPGEIFVALRLARCGQDDAALDQTFTVASDEPETAPGIVRPWQPCRWRRFRPT